MSTTAIAVLLAEGFEEIEAIGIIDILRRANLDVQTVSTTGTLQVSGSHDIVISADILLKDITISDINMVILPGGMPGSANLADNEAVLKLLREAFNAGYYLGAICAAPMVLQAAGILTGQRVTIYPGFEARIPDATCTGSLVEKTGRIITGKGPGAVFAFATAIVEELAGAELAQKLRQGMLIDQR